MPREAGSLLGLKVSRDSFSLNLLVLLTVKHLLHPAENRCH